MELTGWTDSLGRYHEAPYKDQFGVTHCGNEVGDVADIIVYKKVRVLKDGKCYPLFIDKTKPFLFNEWMHCEFHPTKGFSPRSINGTDEEPIGGWHACFYPIAPHISDELVTGEKRLWIKCAARGRMQKYDRPGSQGGTWVLVEWLKPLEILTSKEVKEILNERHFA